MTQSSSRSCRICHSFSNHLLYAVKEMMYGLGETFEYFLCVKCGCLQISEFPPEVLKYYPPDYRNLSFDPAQYYRNPIIKKFRGWRDRCELLGRGVIGGLVAKKFPAHPILKILSSVPLAPSTSVLDVGCSTGVILYMLREAGFRDVLGIDPFLEMEIEYANGLKILRRTIDKVEGAWGLIMFNHSFEHIQDPGVTLRAVGHLLRPDGTCVLRIPVSSSYAWEKYGVRWVQLDAPRHFYLHTPKSIQLLAEAAGLKVQKIVYDSDEFQFWGSEQYMHDIPLHSDRSYSVSPAKSIFQKEDMVRFREKAAQLNSEGKGDQACFFLVKK